MGPSLWVRIPQGHFVEVVVLREHGLRRPGDTAQAMLGLGPIPLFPANDRLFPLADRLRARSRQLGMNARQVAERAGINRSFVYDIMRGRSENPNLEKLDQVAEVLNIDRNWLLHGVGDVDSESPIKEDPMEAFVSIPSVEATASMGGGRQHDADTALWRRDPRRPIAEGPHPAWDLRTVRQDGVRFQAVQAHP